MAIRLSQLTGSYGWNERAARYINLSSGKFISRRAVIGELENVISASSANIDALAQALKNQEMTLAEWRRLMAQEIKTLHTASAAAARGGWAQMSQSDWGWVGSEVKKQYNYLSNFANQIASGRVKLDGRFVQRAKMYADAGRATYEEMRRRMAGIRGMVEERRVLTPGAEHCEDTDIPGCVTLADMDWQPINTLPRIGESPCLVHCKCYFQFRDARGVVMSG